MAAHRLLWGVSSHSSSPLYLQGSSVLNRGLVAGLNGLWLMTKKEKRWRISSFVIFLSFFHPSLTGCKWIFRSCYVLLGKSARYLFRWLVVIYRVCAQLWHCNCVRPRGNKEIFPLPGENSYWGVYGKKLPQGSNKTWLASLLVTYQALDTRFLQPSWLPGSSLSSYNCAPSNMLCKRHGERRDCKPSHFPHCFRPPSPFLEGFRFPDIHDLEYVKQTAFFVAKVKECKLLVYPSGLASDSNFKENSVE